MKTYFLGIAVFGFTIAHIAALSETPTTTTILTVIFGSLIAAVAGVFTLRRDSNLSSQQHSADIRGQSRRLGGSLIAFCAGFLPGTYSGSLVQLNWSSLAPHPAVVVPWDSAGAKAPKDASTASRWLEFAINARSWGLTPKQLADLYRNTEGRIDSNDSADSADSALGVDEAQDKKIKNLQELFGTPSLRRFKPPTRGF